MSRALLAAMLALGGLVGTSSLSAQTVTTNPVGAISFTASAPSGGQPQAFAFNAISLARPAAFVGVLTSQVDNGTTTTLVSDSATWADNAYNPGVRWPTHFVEITSGAFAGLTFDVLSTSGSGKSVTIDGDLGAVSASGATFKIRPHWTLGSLFGVATPPGIQRGNITTADIVSVWTGTSYSSFYHRQSATQNGWRGTGDVAIDQADAVIYPDQGVFFTRRGTSALSVPVVGEVRGDSLAVSLTPGFNLVSSLSAKDITLGASTLYTGSDATGLKTGNLSTADTVSIWDGTAFQSYYVRFSAGAVQGWRKTDNVTTDASGVVIPAGSAAIIRRQPASPAFVWNRPAQTFN